MRKYRRKKKDEVEKREIITEPTRRSIYDVVQSNLKIAKRVAYVHRLLYIGEHHFPEKGENIAEAMENNYKLTNTGYCTEPLSGVLLVYPNHFCYIVEGSEEMLYKHLSLLFKRQNGNIDSVKLLSAIHHVKGRFWNEWMSYHGRPSERVEEIDPESDLENSMRYVKECCEKMYNFANAFINDQLKLRAKQQENEEEEKVEEEAEEPHEQRISVHRTKSLVERDLYVEHLPELKLLRFLVNCKHLKDLKQYHQYYEYIGQSSDYSLKTWPAPKNFIPYDVFDERYNPITDLPLVEGLEPTKEELEEEGEEESTNTIMTTKEIN